MKHTKGVGFNAREYHIKASVCEYWLEFNNTKLVEITKEQYHEMRELIRCYHNWHGQKWKKMAESITETKL